MTTLKNISQKNCPFTLRPLSGIAACIALTVGAFHTQAATKYFDATAGAGNGVGGTGTLSSQTIALFSNSASGDATLSAAAATDDGIFAGTAGTVTLSAAYALNSATFNTTGYVLTASTTTARTLTAPITLAASINLNLIEATQTADRTFGIGSVTGGTGSTLTIQGAETGTSSARVNIAVASSTVSVPTTISGTGTSLAGYVATATGANVTGTITNNSTFTTMIGATSGNDLTLGSAAVISGSAGVQISAGTSGGAGLVTINSANTYSGATTLNNSSSGVVRIGVDNALPTGTALGFGIGSNATGAIDLNGHNQTIGSLAVTSTGAANGIANTSATAASLTISGSASTTYSSTIGIPTVTALANANNNIALTLGTGNAGTLTLTGANPYTGVTTISGGTLKLANTTAAALSGTSQINVNNGGTLLLAANNQINANAPLFLGSATGTGTAKLDGGGFSQGTQAAAGLGALTLSANATIDLTGTTILHFAASPTAAANSILSILDWNGTTTTGGGAELIKFGAANTDLGYLNQVQFINPAGLDAGTYTAMFATGDAGEIVPGSLVTAVPEPSTVFGGMMLAAVVGWMRRRSFAILAAHCRS